MLGTRVSVAGVPSVSFYYDPKRDGDIKSRIKAVAEKHSGPFPGRYSESDWTRRFVLAMLEQEERKLGIKRRKVREA